MREVESKESFVRHLLFQISYTKERYGIGTEKWVIL